MIRLFSMLAISLLLYGCFEKTEGALAVSYSTSTTASASTITWSVDQGPVPPLTFTARNDDIKDVPNVKVRIDLVVTSGFSPYGGDEDMVLKRMPPGVTGSNGTYTIANLAGKSSVTFTPDVWLEPGTYTWTCTVDSASQFKEFNESDNKTQVKVVVNAAPSVSGLDISVAKPTSITPVDAEKVHLTTPVTITGPTGTVVPLLRINVYLYGSNLYYPLYFSNLAVGNHSLILSGVAPSGSTGTYEIVIDEEQLIPESNESNNVITVAYPLTAGG